MTGTNKKRGGCLLPGLLAFLFLLLRGPVFSYALEIADIYKEHERIGEGGITLSIQDADIQTVLKALARQKNLNIVSSPEVNGKVSVHLHDAPLGEALNAVIVLNGFDYARKGNILYVFKGTGGAAGADRIGREVKTYKMNYVDIDEVMKNVREILSPSAMVTVYKPDKTLIVEDTAPRLARLEKVLRLIDVPPLQVLIEAKILEIRLNDDTALGIDWNQAFEHFETSGHLLTQGLANRSEGGGQGLFFQSVSNHFSLFLDALQTQNRVNTLSTPKLIALDGKEAKIIVGGKLGYFVTTATNTTVLQTVEFLEVGTQLVLTPHIMGDGNIIMEIHPEVSDGTVTAGLPSETTTEVTTTLIAKDGGTIFMGGLIRDRKEDIRNQVPGLGCIPFFGVLFGRTDNTTQKTEIIVMITPHIVAPSDREYLRHDAKVVEDLGRELKKERSLKELIPGMKRE